jgi:hypothetical protein
MYQVHGTAVHAAYHTAALGDRRCVAEPEFVTKWRGPALKTFDHAVFTKGCAAGRQSAHFEGVCDAGNVRSGGWQCLKTYALVKCRRSLQPARAPAPGALCESPKIAAGADSELTLPHLQPRQQAWQLALVTVPFGIS